ncbi:MAG: ABC transporter ATP-binding protein [Planctomycetes bacterium]|nr:ABC transporter ATP-binding protein [Planctomycetota bacterium]
MLRCRGLEKRFGNVIAVAGLDLAVEPGETFGLLGPNGAGKSTTIRMALGITRPDAGEVEIVGHGAPTDPAVRRVIGYAPQELALYDELTPVENLRFFGRLQGLTGRRLAERIEWALAFAALEDRRRDRVATFSGGMKRRLNLACAAIHDPELLLLDEPTVGVDPQSRNHLFETVERLAAAGKTIIYTTHYMEEAERLCRRVAIIDRGRVLACDSVAALIGVHGGRSVVETELAGTAGELAAAIGSVADGVLRFEADDAGAAVQRLAAAGVSYRALHVRRPDLEAVFLELTGRRLRDA